MNTWIERKDRRAADIKTRRDLDKILKEWQETGNNADKIVTIMRVLAHEVIEYLKPDMSSETRCAAHEDMVCGCISRLGKIDTSKGRAFNYFTTIMLCVLRQHTMTAKHLMQAKEEFRECIKSRRSRNRNERKV